MFENILIPYDGSESANRALAAAVELGTRAEPVRLTVLQVANSADIDQTSFEVALRMAGLVSEDGHELEELRSHYMTAFKQQMQERVSSFFDSLPETLDVKIVVKRGNPRDVILDYAADNGIDCIVMGRRGLSGIRAALGSVSTAVLRGTELPVLVVK